jgi:hypothetical protein
MTSKIGSSTRRASMPVRRRGQIAADKAASVVAATPKAPPPATVNRAMREKKPACDRRGEGWRHGDHDPKGERPWVLSP